jgi:tight adherence protein B
MVTGFLLAFRPGYLSPLFHTASGIAMLAAGIVFLALGSFWLSRLVKIEV